MMFLIYILCQISKYNHIIDLKTSFCINLYIKFKFVLLDHDAYDKITQA